jgi:urease accessory protein
MTMRATETLPAGTFSNPIDTVSMDLDLRRRRRILLTTASGAEFLLDLPRPAALRDGDGLRLEDGHVVRVLAAPEKLLEIHARDDDALVRIAWHLGNRHLPVQLLPGKIRIREDHVIEAMIDGLGGHSHRVRAPFDPESGAYAGGGGHGHHHHHDDDHHHHAH